MTLKIERISGKRKTRIRLSGGFRAEQIDQVRAEIERCGPGVALDLEEVDLVDVDAVRFPQRMSSGGRPNAPLLGLYSGVDVTRTRSFNSSRGYMNSLLKLATEAHGGVERWNRLNSLKAQLSVTGGIWHVKGRPDVLKDIRIELPLHEERLITHFVGQNKRFVFTPDQVSVEDERGHLIEKRDDPRRAFEGQSYETP